MAEASHVAALGQNAERDDGTDTWKRLEAAVIRMVPKHLIGPEFELFALVRELRVAPELEPEGLDGN